MTRRYSNNYKSTLNGAILSTDTTITVTSASGLPTLTGSDTCQVTIDDGTNVEIVTVTAIVGSDLTVTRAQESTTAVGFADGTTIALRATALGMENAVQYTGEDRAVDLGGAASLEIPNGAAPTVDVAGEIAVDTTITDHTGLITYHDGTEALYAVGMPIANLSALDGYVVAYNATNNEFEMVSGGGAIALNDLTDVTTSTSGSGRVVFDSHARLRTSAPLVTGGGVTLDLSGGTTAQQYGWVDSLSVLYPKIVGGTTSEYIDFNVDGPRMVSGARSISVKSTGTVISGPVDLNNDITINDNKGFLDNNGNEVLKIRTVTSAVNYIDVYNSVTGAGPIIQTQGDDTNVDLKIQTKGTGFIRFNNSMILDNNFSFHQQTSAGASAILLRLTSSDTLNVGQSNANNVALNLYGGTGVVTLNAGSVEVMRALTTGRVGIGTTAPTSTLGVNGNIHASGISFDSGTNTLNQYEEGTWSPLYTTTGTGFTTMTMGTASGTYTRIGNVVIVRALFDTNDVDITGATGVVLVSGLPFTVALSKHSAFTIGSAINFNSNAPLHALARQGSTNIGILYRSSIAANASDVAPSDLTTGTITAQNQIILSGIYFI